MNKWSVVTHHRGDKAGTVSVRMERDAMRSILLAAASEFARRLETAENETVRTRLLELRDRAEEAYALVSSK